MPHLTPMPTRPSPWTALAAALLLMLTAVCARAADELPPGVAARVHGVDIPESEVFERLALRDGRSERGQTVLDQMIEDECVRQEAERKGVTATEAEALAYRDQVEKTIRAKTGNLKGLADVYAEEESNEEEFLVIARDYIVRQKLAAEVFGLKPGQEVPEHRMQYWVKMVRRRAKVQTEDLPKGVLARVGDQDITVRSFARLLGDRLPPEALQTVVEQMVYEVAAREELAKAGVVPDDADLAAEMSRIRRLFKKDARVQGTGVEFDDFLRKTRGYGEADLLEDPAFRIQVGMRKHLLTGVGTRELREHWESNRDAYGERALVRAIFIQAGDGGGKFKDQMLSHAEGYKLALRAKVAVNDATGAYDPEAKGAPLPDTVTSVAKQFCTDDDKRETAGEPTAWTRISVRAHEDLEKAVFEGELGTLLGPIRTDVGYFLIVVEERRPAPKFEELTETLREHVLRDRLDKFRLKLRLDVENVVMRKYR